ncbi:unnamed protein product [Spodoptera littoralis]|uniref:CUB domain-containing protein n=1 Tax=Spodoptera littoralis TaxID=7109 RepID=A0A9P0I3W2_SPOLI|nr:unnamed protein product [Spodoptera littoralis]CAH1638460.1 unnamed protein product [Spodoptera littoralis]
MSLAVSLHDAVLQERAGERARPPRAMWRAALALAALVALGARGAAGGCGVAEFACRSGACVRLDAYCDGEAHCADGSDEPAHCSVCNRTYYGRVGVAYAVAVRSAPRAPFLCHLTFTAGGGAHGDLVQLAFDEFRVGRYEPGAMDGCPDGYMQLSELGRPFTGGSWCGEADGAALYYSETATVTVSVKLFRARLGENFGFRLRYKFLAQRDAVVRFGAMEAPLERGAVSPGTYCTRTYEECHRKPCRLQSPNYPGMYPRNVTCYWSLRQKDIPTCKHAMISVRQEHSHKMQIKRSISMASLNKTGRVVRAWRECTGERDRLIFYDGASTDDPVLVEYCGGDWLPRVTSRGPEMLVAFHSSPFSAPLRPPAPAAPLRGFELDVDVVFADSDSLDYAREARRCEFHVKASSSEEETNTTIAGSGRGRRGKLRAPAHTLPPNTTCTWTFHGRPGDLVWIYFSSFTQYSLVEPRRIESAEREEEGGVGATRPRSGRARPAAGACAVELRIWDGGGADEAGTRALGRYCDAAPALCARAALANATRAPRPCAPPDGYVSAAPLLSLAATSRPGTATHPLEFALHYEFVDARLEGAPLPDDGRRPRALPNDCARWLTTPGAFASPRNALWFGRGGARRLRCVYRLEAADARVALELVSASFGREPRCVTRSDALTGRLVCAPDPLDARPEDADVIDEGLVDFDGDDDTPLRVPHLKIYESPWPGYRVPVACICDNSSAPLRLQSGGGALELELVARALAPAEDHRHLHFRGTWARAPAPAPPPACAARRRLPPPGARVHLLYPYSGNRISECGETPFLLEARGNRSVFLRVWGEELPLSGGAGGAGEPPPCATANRVLVYEAHSARLVRVVCPAAGGRALQLFSAEWWGRGARPGALLVVWAAREPGAARFSWMEVWRAGPAPRPLAPGEAWPNASAACAHPCAALGACMAPALWCDGESDCPGGGDEAGACGAGARLLAALAAPAAAGAAAAAACGAAALALLVAALLRRRRRAGADKQLLGALAAGRRLTEELLFDASRASSAASS